MELLNDDSTSKLAELFMFLPRSELKLLLRTVLSRVLGLVE